MPASLDALFQTVNTKDPLNLFKGGEVEPKKVVKFLDLDAEDVATAAQVQKGSVRFDNKMSSDLRRRLTEIAVVCDLVAEHFGGDIAKTALWFQVRNPLLGNLPPRDMIRFGRFDRLMGFIQAGLAGQRP